jgi:NADPH-dependent 7-cyano-7-deazaguanine reductase QueF-like protein
MEDSNYLTNYEKSLMDKINSNIHNLQLHLNETQNNLQGTNTRTMLKTTLDEEISNRKGK